MKHVLLGLLAVIGGTALIMGWLFWGTWAWRPSDSEIKYRMREVPRSLVFVALVVAGYLLIRWAW